MAKSDLPTIQPPTTCNDCGACCLHMGYPPFIGMYDYDAAHGDEEWLALPREMALECRQGAVDGRGDKELPCIWLDLETKRCRNYSQRPRVCREFEIGESACIVFRIERGIVACG